MNNILGKIPIKIKNQHQLLNLLAEGYKTLSKALMEYIDNSFDSGEDFFDENAKKYNRDLEIDILIDRENNRILIKDNCEGMCLDIIEGLANSINESQKKRREQKRAWVNGQFGLGAHAFRFFSQELRVTTKQHNGPLLAICIDKDSQDAFRMKPNDVNFNPSGTLVELCKIDNYQMRNIKAEDLKKEIEIYFEMLLRRNVIIKIIDNGVNYICQPFNYNDLTGKEIRKIITSWTEGKGSGGKAKISVPADKGIIVNLKVCTDKINRPPFFSRKGRRINYISQLDSFIRKTEHRKKVWEHYYLTGYIEVQENLEPVITRDDFVGSKGYQQRRSGIYEEIVKLEDEIYTAIEVINKDKSDESFRNLATRLTDLLSEIVKEEEIKLKYQNKGDKSRNKDVEKFTQNNESDTEFKVKVGHSGEGRIRGGSEEIIKGDQNSEGNLKGIKIEKQKQGIKIEFSTLPSDERTHYGDGVITIFTDHPDFQTRKSLTHRAELGTMKITARLANYLAAVISGEFKEIFYQQKKLEPSRKLILNEQIDFIFKFEERMKDLIDQPLSSIGLIK